MEPFFFYKYENFTERTRIWGDLDRRAPGPDNSVWDTEVVIGIFKIFAVCKRRP